MKATELLHRQHQMILQLLRALEGEHHYRLPLLRDLDDQLAQHVADEAGAFVAAVRALGPRAIAAMRHTHGRATEGVARLWARCNDGERFAEEVRSLREALTRLIAREETELLAPVERNWDEARLVALGDRLAARTPPPPAGDSAPDSIGVEDGEDGENHGAPRVPREA